MLKLEPVIHKDTVGWYAALMKPDGSYARRTLSTPHEGKAEAWLRQGQCHGWNAHHKTCPDCALGEESSDG